jgi:N-methylhydantoinase B
VLFEEYALAEGSGGAGRQRGGFGVRYAVRLRRGEARASFVMDHGRIGPNGADGGGAGGVNRVRLEIGGTEYAPPHLSKDQDIAIRPGDCVTVETPGGGGFGDPFVRAADAVARDVQRGYYTPREAADRFGVVLDRSLQVDAAETARRRARRA